MAKKKAPQFPPQNPFAAAEGPAAKNAPPMKQVRGGRARAVPMPMGSRAAAKKAPRKAVKSKKSARKR
jgi:hypothetical protein